MKTRFTTLDISAVLTEINTKLVGMRLANVYDVNNKTYLLKLAKPDAKAMLLMESGIRLHTSEFEWPKNMMPSGFSMKLRKHLRGRRLISAKQLGIDRIVDIQFGSDEAAYHIILELYDRGNIILTDHQHVVLTLLRFRREKPKDQTSEQNGAVMEEDSDVRFVVHDPYPLHAAKQAEHPSDIRTKIQEALKAAKPEALLKRVLNPHLSYGAACIEHCLRVSGYSGDEKVCAKANEESEVDNIIRCLEEGERLQNCLTNENAKGYVIQKVEKKKDGSEIKTNIEFHPFLFKQHQLLPHLEFDSFNQAVDEFFGSLESQKIDMKILQQERSAYKKLENIKKDHEQRLALLKKEQDTDVVKASIVEANLNLVDQAIRVVRTAIANQIDWNEISSLINDAKANGDPVAQSISKLKLQSNEMTMVLHHEPDEASDSDDDFFSDEESDKHKPARPPVKIDIDLGLSAYANAKRYYDKKRQAASKQQKTIDATEKAMKSAEKKTNQTLKEAATVRNIQKARKTFWFEKFFWFVSSENYLVLGGRDAQQNEILVKKHLNTGDVYVHADLHGATSCIIKNTGGSEVPPKTLNEAGTMAICHSAAWSAKVVTSAWWVYHHQVSKTAPSGEYLTTGSFLIRGKKNYLPPSYLVYGFGILFKVDETCIHKHKDERKVCIAADEVEPSTESVEDDVEIEDSRTSDSDQVDGGSGEEGMENPATADSSETPKATGSSSAVEFPETELKLNYAHATVQNTDEEAEAETDVLYLGDKEPVPYTRGQGPSKPHMSAKQRRARKKGNAGDSEETVKKQPPDNAEKPTVDNSDSKSGASQVAQPKRGQRNKMKKLKGKYKDQDEEERLLKMELLQQAQSQKSIDRKAKKNKANSNQGKANQPAGKQTNKNSAAPVKRPVVRLSDTPCEKPRTEKRAEADGYESDEEREKILQNEHLAEESINILNSLTGCPFADDVLMFALPVCAPYNTLQNYKYKVKLTPGNTKKGKGTKTALAMFQNLREATLTERDHLRSVKDLDLACNLPGKVKVSAPNLHAHRKKK